MKSSFRNAIRSLPPILRNVGVTLTILAAVHPASAVLGGDVVSVQSDAVRMKASVKSTVTTSYTLHEIQAPSGTMVREYISTGGKVFAVGWRGQQTPDLKNLLGAYFPQFQQAVAEAHRNHVGRRPLFVQLPGLSIQIGGHMRALFGKVYVPEMLPQGVRAETLK